MSRIVPSAVARVIAETFPWAAATLKGGQPFDGALSSDAAPQVAMILGLVDKIPGELAPQSLEDHTIFIASCAAMRGALMSWSGGGHPSHLATLRPAAIFKNRHPIVALLDVLRRCDDESSSADTAALAFLSDVSAREDIRVDMTNSHRALGNGEFKASTVLAGSVIEALLLWAVRQLDAERLATAVSATGRRTLDKRGPEFWHLTDLVDVARSAGVIDEQTAISARLASDYRNLIHPGRIVRTGARCDQATALGALSAMERVATAVRPAV